MIVSTPRRPVLGPCGRGLALALALTAVGCKSGSSWTAKPSWWSLGGTDPAKLASDSDDVAKPSTTAKPYPTTSTPEGYVLDKANGSGVAQVAATSPTTSVPSAVTYGSTPSPSVAPVSPATTAAAAPATTAGGLAGIAPQVGPYGNAASGPTPPTDTLPAASPSGAFAGMAASAATAGYGAAPAESSPVRVADARGSDAWASAAPAPASGGSDTRYGSATGSRFSSVPVTPPPPTTDPLAGLPPMQPAEPGPAMAPAAMPAIGPAATPSSLAPPTPTRRPDPGYRPGGTSTYRPSRTILAGDEPEGSIQPVSYEAPAGS